jgi:hypothetical protein
VGICSKLVVVRACEITVRLDLRLQLGMVKVRAGVDDGYVDAVAQ